MQDKGGYVYLALTSTQLDQDVWLIDSRASYDMTPHREWFCEYMKVDMFSWGTTRQPKLSGEEDYD
jgi:hypothetical protein